MADLPPQDGSESETGAPADPGAESPKKSRKGGASLLRQGSSLGIFTLGSRVLGLVREMVKAAYLGTSPVSDAFSVAFLIPNLFRRLFAENSMSVAFIPTFRDYYESADGKKMREFLSAIFTFLSLILTLTVVAGVILTPLIVPLFGTMTDETVLLTRIMFPYLAVISVAAFFQGILNGVKIFNPSGFTPILFNIAVIGTTVLFSRFMENPGRAMALGVLIGGIIQAAFQLPFVLKQGFRFGFAPLPAAFRNPGTRQVLRLIGPTIIGMAAYQINDVVSTALAGGAGVGVVSSLSYSLRLQELILGIFAVTIGTIILPGLSSFASRGEWDKFYGHLGKALQTIALITIPIAVFAAVSAKPIIRLLFQSQAFDETSVQLTFEAFRWHILGLFFIALNRVLAPAFYAQKDSKSPTWAGLLNFAVNISLAAALVGPLAGGGIAMALSIASVVNSAALFVLLARKKGAPWKKLLGGLAVYCGKIGVVAGALGAAAYWGMPLFYSLAGRLFAGAGRILEIGLPLFLGAGVYGGLGVLCLVILRDPLVGSLIRRRRA